ncbi:hypothetical protein B2J93_5775 [Marssonina coronariae]|uniref:FAD dependent oxidoreductase domain-containing protein n=1 Tax=Diplocarpon coronariae TaxID=2795749 RepID=A0A218YYT4_9HELO|nr:hypothetical protein B2J93_5775 [Marssonina coronariae]
MPTPAIHPGLNGLAEMELCHSSSMKWHICPHSKTPFVEEGITEEVGFRLGETFDAAMSDEAWMRLEGAYELMQNYQGAEGDVIRDCRLIEDPVATEEFTQMKGFLGAVVHPSGQVWPYRFVHALLRIVLKARKLNLHRDSSGWIRVKTSRGEVRTHTIVHATNRWASHLIPELSNLVFSSLATASAIKAPEGFLKRTVSQNWDSVNYHLQLPPPYNTIVVGGTKQLLSLDPRRYIGSECEDIKIDAVPEFYKKWPASDLVGWEGSDSAEFGRETGEGRCWTGGKP